MSRPQFVDNREGNTLSRAINAYLDDLNSKLADEPDLDIVTGYFNPRGYFSVANGFRHVGDVRILLGAEPREKDREEWRKPGEPRGEEYDRKKVDAALKSLDQGLERDRNLLGFSREIDSKLKELVDFLRSDRVEVRRFEDGFIHGKAYLFSHDEGVIAGSSNFTGAGLNSNLELNLGQYNPHVTGQVKDWFEDLWGDSEDYDLAELYDERFEPYSPYLIYLRALWERYGEEIEEEKEEDGGRINLTNFQNDGFRRALRFIEKHNGVIVADEVGLGKTFIAGKVLEKYINGNRQKALVVAPAYLRDGMWAKVRSKWSVHFDIVSYSQLRNDRQLGGTHQHIPLGLDEYQLVVIDEAHGFRNPGTDQAQALLNLLRGDPPKDLMLLTATPVNNSLWDLYYLLAYFIKNDATFASEGIPSLRERFKQAQSEDPADLTPDMLFDILDETTVRRTRRFIKTHYPNETLPDGKGGKIRITFPDVKPVRVDYHFNENFSDDFFRDVSSGLAAGDHEEADLTLARYIPSRYTSGGEEISEINLVGLLRTGLLKRFESSGKAFSNTLKKMINQNETALNLLDNGFFPVPEAIDEWVEADNDEAFEEAFEDGAEINLESVDVDEERFRKDLKSDLEILNRWRNRVEEVDTVQDEKLHILKDTLIKIVKDAEADSSNEDAFRRNRKVLLFSYYEDTVDHILDYLEQIIEEDERLHVYRDRIAGVSGSESKRGIPRWRAVQGFAPESTDAPEGTEDEFDILVTTDVLGQGVNLQQARNVINYDLPWNPMRVVQRNGRIDRINSPHPKIFAYSFFPEDRLDDLLRLENRVRQKLTTAARSIGLDSEVIPDMETVDNNFADRVRNIQSLHDENPEILEQGGTEAAAFSGEEYRQELRQGLKDYEDEITTLPWGAGSGFRSTHPGYFFCARIGEEVYMRYIPINDEEPVRDTLTCLRRIECSRETTRDIPDETRKGVYDAWEIAREDIYLHWQEQTDPRNIEPEIRKLFRDVAQHLREHPPHEISHDELIKIIESVEAPWGRRYERELREVYKQDIGPIKKSEKLIEKVKELGLQPFKAPEPLPPIDKEEVKLVCWLAIAPKNKPQNERRHGLISQVKF